MEIDKKIRLDSSIAVPLMYFLIFDPNTIDDSFTGQLHLEVMVKKTTDLITLHACELTFKSIVLVHGDRHY